MNSLRCSNCALLNFATADTCKRCGMPFNAAAETVEAEWDSQAFAPSENQPQPTEGNSNFWDQPSYRPSYVPPPPVSAGSGGPRVLRILIAFAIIAAVSGLALPVLLKKKSDFSNLSWVDYKSSDNKFSVSLPVAPKISEQSIPSPFGNAQAYVLEADVSKAGGCMLMYADYPAHQINVSEDTLYDMAIQGATRRQTILAVGARRYITLDGHRGVEIQLTPTDPKMKVIATSRIFWVPPRLYVMVAGGPETSEFKAVQTRCLDSFRLLRSN
jgi:hypothetical protein